MGRSKQKGRIPEIWEKMRNEEKQTKGKCSKVWVFTIPICFNQSCQHPLVDCCLGGGQRPPMGPPTVPIGRQCNFFKKPWPYKLGVTLQSVLWRKTHQRPPMATNEARGAWPLVPWNDQYLCHANQTKCQMGQMRQMDQKGQKGELANGANWAKVKQGPRQGRKKHASGF